MVDRSSSGSSLHHKNVAGLEARCTLDVDYVVGDVIECQGCLEEMSSALLNSTSIPERTTLASLMDVILGSTSQGVTVPDLLVRSQSCVSGRSLIICIALGARFFLARCISSYQCFIDIFAASHILYCVRPCPPHHFCRTRSYLGCRH
jgi:hypothetical protein